MHVRTPVETLSNSVADGLEFMKTVYEDFDDVDATAKYLRIFNDVFDIMNSTKKSSNSTGYKKPIDGYKKPTFQTYFRRFDEAIDHMKQLRIKEEHNFSDVFVV